MSGRIEGADGAPRWVTLFNPITRPLLAAGLPLGPNGLLTVPGRKSGLTRSTPLAIIEVDGRRWIWSPWGDVHWVRNLRAARRATITIRGRAEDITATELDRTERIEFFRDVLAPVARDMRLGMWFVRTVDGTDLDHPLEAAEGRVAFELHPA